MRIRHFKLRIRSYAFKLNLKKAFEIGYAPGVGKVAPTVCKELLDMENSISRICDPEQEEVLGYEIDVARNRLNECVCIAS